MTVSNLLSYYPSLLISQIFFSVRSILAVVPQNADLFEGTLRENIDPVGLYSDIDIWDTLDQVCSISELFNKLSLSQFTGSS